MTKLYLYREIGLMDDVISFLREAERKGIPSFHISSFLNWDYQDEFVFENKRFHNLTEPSV